MKPALQVQPEAASLPADELDPEGQLLQAPAPDEVLNLPEGHLLHDPEPGVSLYSPGAQDAHGPPSGPVKPASHVQSDGSSLPAGELDPEGQMLHAPAPDKVLNLPEGQLLHAPAPGSALKVPAAQGAHGPPSGPVKPASQVQADREELPAGESES